ncbi:hypothetical protein ACFFIS_03440 [Virgibacillus soli]
MKEKRSIVVKLNEHTQKDHTSREHAAALESIENQQRSEEEIPSFYRNYTDFQYNKEKKRRDVPVMIKKFFVASISAIIIGSLFGIIMLKMFSNLDNQQTSEPQYSNQYNSTSGDMESDAEDKQRGAKEKYTLQPLQMFVLQGGLFSEQVNAESGAEQFLKVGHAGVVWEREGQYFLFVGLAETEQQAKTLVKSMQDESFETFVKPLQVDEITIELSKAEHTWYTKFHTLWQQMLKQEDDSYEEQLKKLIGDSPSNRTDFIVQGMEPLLKQLELGNLKNKQQLLLYMAKYYEQSLKE